MHKLWIIDVGDMSVRWYGLCLLKKCYLYIQEYQRIIRFIDVVWKKSLILKNISVVDHDRLLNGYKTEV